MNYFEKINPDNMLHAIGLRRNAEAAALSATLLPALALFGAGLVVGAGVALLTAPKSGRELRDDLSRKAAEITDTVRNKMPMLTGNERKGTNVYDATSAYDPSNPPSSS